MSLVLSLILLFGAGESAEASGKSGWESIADRVVKKTLPNGLRILMLDRGEAPVVSFHTYVDVGSVDEHVGITGVAHMFEHMAFKGSSRIGTKDWDKEKELLATEEAAYQAWREAKRGKDEKDIAAKEASFRAATKELAKWIEGEAFSTVIEKAGGVGLNASTSVDATQYFYSLPANKVELWAWLESERFADPVLREFYKERDVVKEERRMRTESSPQGQLVEAILASAFLAHPYGQPTIGYMSDLDSLSRAEAERFYQEHYSPEKTVVAVVGKIDANTIFPMLEKYFSRIPENNASQRVVTIEPEQRGEKRVRIETPANPIIVLGFHRPAWDHVDDPVLDHVSEILGSGRFSRLYKRLVKQDQIAVQVSTSSNFPGGKYPSLFAVFAIPTPDHSVEECETAIWEEIEKLATDGPNSDEMEGVKRRAKARFLGGLDSNAGLARSLSRYEALAGDFHALFEQTARIEKVSVEDVKRATKQYFIKKNCTVGTLVKTPMKGAN